MYKKREHVHFMGIGGIGMSGIAEILKLRGYTVSGCDLGGSSSTLKHLSSIGCIIHQGHDVSHIRDADVLVYSSAVKHDAPEICVAMEKGIPVIPRALMLGELMRTKYSVAVSGAHGKTTTTSLISHIMIEAERHPTVIVGGILKNISNNAQLGSGEILIAEADESDRSLLNLSPTMAVVTNIDAEHLDTYSGIDDIKDTFKQFLARLPFYGKAFVCMDDPNVRSILPLPHVCTVKYGLSTDADIMGEIIEMGVTSSTFDVYRNSVDAQLQREKKLLGRVILNIPGHHNVLNSLAAIGVGLEFDVPFEIIAQALETFKGVERRFEFKGMFNGAEIFDDYGHHPTEIKTTLLVAQKRAQGRLHVIFQPHRFTRTAKLWNEFVEVFARYDQAAYRIDTLYITDIYPASEAPIAGITAQRLIQAISQANPAIQASYLSSYDLITQQVQQVIQPGDLVLTIGAGKINQVAEALVALNQAPSSSVQPHVCGQ